MSDSTDPILASRARIARLVQAGLRFGYGAFGLAMVLFFLGFPLSFPSWLTAVITILLGVGSVVLAPAIVFKYGVQAADRADRDQSW